MTTRDEGMSVRNGTAPGIRRTATACRFLLATALLAGGVPGCWEGGLPPDDLDEVTEADSVTDRADGGGNGATDSAPATTADAGGGVNAEDVGNFEERVRDLVAEMTLSEKVSQMGHQAPAIPRLDIAAYNWWNEALHGVARSGIATVFPQAIALAGTFDPHLIFDVATAISTEARVKNNTEGKPLTYWSPTINLARDPRWGRNEETYGEDPFLASRIAVAFVTGMQGNDPLYLKTVSTPKHFIANNEEARRHTGSSDVDGRNLREHYMPAFKAAVMEGGAYSVMCAYNALNGIPSCANRWLLDEVLRGEWGFSGYVVSDCWAIQDIVSNHHYVDTNIAASQAAIAAGTDLNCGGRYQPDLVSAVGLRLVSEEAIDTAVSRLFLARFKLGEFDPPSEVPYTAIPATALDSPEHSALAREAARESMVLLKNSGVLPLDPTALGSIAVIGPNAARLSFGGYSGQASSPTSPLAGIQQRLTGYDVRVDYAAGTGMDAQISPDDLQQAIDIAAGADLVLAVLGTDVSIANEGFDRTDIGLPQVQEELLRGLVQANANTVLVLVSGMPLSVPWADDNVPAILNAWYGGQAAGEVIAEILFGDTNPSGRLPQTCHRSVEDLPPFDDYNIIDGKRTYMYFDGPVLYPFGHGLSYTRFAYSDLAIQPEIVPPDGEFTVSFTLENTGGMAGDEVAQLYVHDVEARVPVPVRALKGFTRQHVPAGETREVSITVEAADLALFDTAQGRFLVDPGAFDILVGASSEDLRLAGRLTVE